VLIQGRVQGVWYRGWTVEAARALGLSGWVRNRSDGAVEAVFSGPAPDVDAMLNHCHQGPPAAQVQSVSAEVWNEPVAAGFRQIAIE
jgi:acylphosphatase|tara:strand:- start:23 stop:283 length:261 start_codon:yes stop_codon:yes gene_type:complete